jgi:hypothetical protein
MIGLSNEAVVEVIGDVEGRATSAQTVPRLQSRQEAEDRVTAIVSMDVGPCEALTPLKGPPRRLPDPHVLVLEDPGDHRGERVMTKKEHGVGDGLADLPLGMGRQSQEPGSNFDLQQIVDLLRAELISDLLQGFAYGAPVTRIQIPKHGLFFVLRHGRALQ